MNSHVKYIDKDDNNVIFVHPVNSDIRKIEKRLSLIEKKLGITEGEEDE